MRRSVRATASECHEALPGDELIPDPLGSLTHAITIRGGSHDVWPWLVQMGAGRAGWYSYDLLDNKGDASANRIVPEFQPIAVGALRPALQGITEGFVVLGLDPLQALILGFPLKDGTPGSTWVFVLRETVEGTRLIVRARGSRKLRFFGLPPAIGKLLSRVVHFVMQRKQLIGLAERVERSVDTSGRTKTPAAA